MNKNLKNWLLLNQLYGLSRQEKAFLIEHLDELESLCKKGMSQLRHVGFSEGSLAKIKQVDWGVIERELVWSSEDMNHIITQKNSAYPNRLKEISSAPPVLFVKGNLELLSQAQFAMVGSRKPTVSGREMARQFASELAASGFVITSGLALGIDGESHLGALQSGKTIAVLGNNITHIYPPSHRQLAENIRDQGGAIVSEFSFSMGIHKENFPRRNRIISGLSYGLLVVEATIRSGSLITAQLAMEQNRDVFAIPGSVKNPLSQGCHYLIQQGAKLVNSSQDIIEEYPFLKSSEEICSGMACHTLNNTSQDHNSSLNAKEKKLLSVIGFEITSIDTIMIRSNFTAQEILSILPLLELSGYVKSASGGYYRI